MTLSSQGAAPISDEELTAYLDGAANAELCARIEAACETSAELQARLQELSAPLDAVRAAWDDALAHAPHMPALPTPTARSVPVMPFGLGLAAGLAMAVLFQWQTLSDATSTGATLSWTKWQRYAAAYQVLYVPETLAAWPKNPEATKRQLARLSQRFDLDLAAVSELSGATVRRGQLLAFEDKPLAQIALQADNGTPLAFCILRRSDKPEAQMRLGQLEGLAAAEWSRGEYAFLLVGGDNQDTIEQIAAQLAETI